MGKKAVQCNLTNGNFSAYASVCVYTQDMVVVEHRVVQIQLWPAHMRGDHVFLLHLIKEEQGWDAETPPLAF